ncbi:FecR domain-containing protein [Sandaracinus amylolyticus]|uniref:FecR domain-containing protein n=1 Tax=Sandaracinus amylolyticus TaxID=927083 RepID=UPI001F354FD7|nr:FecR family protein [Sandaracinus amylolyticus]UJR78552.1 FecR domain-containing protein [Sandaracinus amylolyticus]
MKRSLPSLPERIADTLDLSVDEARVQRTWRGARRRAAVPSRRTAGAVVGVIAVAAVVALAVLARRDEPVVIERGGLLLAGGGAPVAREVSEGAAPETLRFAEASAITLWSSARLVPLHNDGARFETELERGRARFSVTPGLGRAWRVVAGDVQVEVVGTVFEVEHTEGRTSVSVERGVVRVSGPRVPGLVVTLRAGEDVVVEREVATPREPLVVTSVEPIVAEEAPAPRAPIARPSEWRDLATRGRHDEAYEALRGRGIVREAERASPEQLLLLADVARLSGHPAEAVAPLERLLAEHPRDESASLAAVTLGRLFMDALGRPEDARRALERARELGVPAALRADVDRRIQALEVESTP